MNRNQCIQALECLCDAMDCCDNCPIGQLPVNAEFCRNHEFKDMSMADLVRYAEIVDFKYDGSEDNPVTPEEDLVNHPNHYTSGGIECIDAIAASMTPIEYAGFLKGQILKYVWRYRLKGKPVQDLKKARFYLDRLIQLTEKEEVAV